mmetsp:Transcript_1167/g.4506  ORF Transcript_1167/g.4506 Transcript_1167/m.4506 type:complete len:427 (+) Transcript_1167:795-2075(+)
MGPLVPGRHDDRGAAEEVREGEGEAVEAGDAARADGQVREDRVGGALHQGEDARRQVAGGEGGAVVAAAHLRRHAQEVVVHPAADAEGEHARGRGGPPAACLDPLGRVRGALRCIADELDDVPVAGNRAVGDEEDDGNAGPAAGRVLHRGASRLGGASCRGAGVGHARGRVHGGRRKAGGVGGGSAGVAAGEGRAAACVCGVGELACHLASRRGGVAKDAEGLLDWGEDVGAARDADGGDEGLCRRDGSGGGGVDDGARRCGRCGGVAAGLGKVRRLAAPPRAGGVEDADGKRVRGGKLVEALLECLLSGLQGRAVHGPAVVQEEYDAAAEDGTHDVEAGRREEEGEDALLAAGLVRLYPLHQGVGQDAAGPCRVTDDKVLVGDGRALLEGKAEARGDGGAGRDRSGRGCCLGHGLGSVGDGEVMA